LSYTDHRHSPWRGSTFRPFANSLPTVRPAITSISRHSREIGRARQLSRLCAARAGRAAPAQRDALEVSRSLVSNMRLADDECFLGGVHVRSRLEHGPIERGPPAKLLRTLGN